MNSSNTKSEQSGFPSSIENFSDSGLNKPGLGSAKPVFGSSVSGRSKPRMAKFRRHGASNYPRSTLPSDTGNIDPGFNPFRPISDNSSLSQAAMGSSVSGNLNLGSVGNEGFVFGASQEKLRSNFNSEIRNSSGFVDQILDDMRKLKIDREINSDVREGDISSGVAGSDKGSPVFRSVYKMSVIDESTVSKLPDEMRKVNIEGSGDAEKSYCSVDMNSNSSAQNKTHFSFGSSNNIPNSIGSSVPSELTNELKKLNIEDAGVADRGNFNHKDGDTKKFVFGDINKSGYSLDASSASILPDKMKHMNLRDYPNTYGGEKKEVNLSAGEKTGFVFTSSSSASVGLDDKAEILLSDEIRKLKIAREAGVNKKFQDGMSSIPADFSSQEGQQGQSLSGSRVPPDHCQDYGNLHRTTASSSSFSSTSVGFQPVGKVMEVPSTDRPEKKDEFNFTSSWDEMRTRKVEFTMPNRKGNMISGFDKKLEFNAKRESAKDVRSKKKREKMRKRTPAGQWIGQDSVSRKSDSQEHPGSFESYSPMDVSPYPDTLVYNEGSRETSLTSEEAFQLYSNNASGESPPLITNDATDEDLISATEHLDINQDSVNCTKTNAEGSQYSFGEGTEGPLEDSVLGAETESFHTAAEQFDYSSDTFFTDADSEVSSSSKTERQDSDGRMQFRFASGSQDVGGTSFAFAASSSAQGLSSTANRPHKKKNNIKNVKEYVSPPTSKTPHASSSTPFVPLSETSLPLSPRQGRKGDLPTSFSRKGDKSVVVKGQDPKEETVSTLAGGTTAQEACEKWRLRGNLAYANGDMSQAEEYYTHGVNCVSENENSRSCLRALMLCYSNRAATRMSLGRMREALADCMNAVSIDPNFLRVQVRAANCYLALGEVEDASLHFIKCLQSGSNTCVDRKLVVEASVGLEKAQKVSEFMKQSAELLHRRTCIDAESALGVITEALTISSYCEKLLEMKADALLMLRKHEELIQLCENTLGFAEMNCSAISASLDCSSVKKDPSFRLWRWHMIIKSYFYLGRLEEALDFLKKQEESLSTSKKNESKTLESLIPLASTIRELICHKAAGNEVFQLGRHAEAVEHYTAALSCTVQSRPFAAVCFCNRAAAYKAMGQIIDAIADCSLAMALDGNYLKAISRRATLFEMIRDYEQASIDLQRLVSLLMKQVEDKANQSGGTDRRSTLNEVRQAQQQQSDLEEEARNEIPLNMYLILGVDASVTASEIKKAYRKAALRHHPDKTGQSLAKIENGDNGLWKEVVEEVHKDADRLFKMIGEAYAVLSDPTKRSRYDLEEEMRNVQKRGNGGSTSRMDADVQNHPFQRSSSRHQWREVWRSYGNSQSRDSESTRWSRYS